MGFFSKLCLLACLLVGGWLCKERTTVHSATLVSLKVGWSGITDRQGSVIHQFIIRTEQNRTEQNISASDGINQSIHPAPSHSLGGLSWRSQTFAGTAAAKSTPP